LNPAGDNLAAIHIREALSDDLPHLMALEQRCFQGDRISKRQMRYLLRKAKARTWLLSCGSVVAAYCLCFTPALPRPARIYSIAVQPEYRGQGLATKLLKAVLENLFAMHYTRCRLEVSVGNQSAQKLYASFGFRTIEKLPAYYQDGADGLRMEKDLSEGI